MVEVVLKDKERCGGVLAYGPCHFKRRAFDKRLLDFPKQDPLAYLSLAPIIRYLPDRCSWAPGHSRPMPPSAPSTCRRPWTLAPRAEIRAPTGALNFEECDGTVLARLLRSTVVQRTGLQPTIISLDTATATCSSGAVQRLSFAKAFVRVRPSERTYDRPNLTFAFIRALPFFMHPMRASAREPHSGAPKSYNNKPWEAFEPRHLPPSNIIFVLLWLAASPAISNCHETAQCQNVPTF